MFRRFEEAQMGFSRRLEEEMLALIWLVGHDGAAGTRLLWLNSGCDPRLDLAALQCHVGAGRY